jgi:hypothetical protein
MPRRLVSAGALVLLIALASGCTASATTPSPTPSSTAGSASLDAEPTPEPSDSATDDAAASVVGTVVRFTSGRTFVDVTVEEDSPGVRDFLSMLPLEVTIEEFNGREKIAYLPRELEYEGSRGSDPEDGDLIYYTPWGNLGFYYNADGIEYSDSTLHIGTYQATEEELSLLEGAGVTIEIVE